MSNRKIGRHYVLLATIVLVVVAALSPAPRKALAYDEGVERAVFDYCVNEMGLNDAAACGVIANIYYESSFRLTAVGDNGTSYGLCQWHNSRWTGLVNHCNAYGLDSSSVYGQMHWLQYELEHSERSTGNYLKLVANTPDGAYDAGYNWCVMFERPSNPASKGATRGARARDVCWPKYRRNTAPTWNYGGDAWLENGWYTIRPVAYTGKYLEIGGGYEGDGGNAQIWTHSWPGDEEHIKFHLNRLDDGSYAVDTFAGRVLDVSEGSSNNGANVHQWIWNGSDAQRWYINDCGNGVYALQAKCSGKYLDLAGGGTGNGNNVQQWEYANTDNQRWVITPCNLYGGKVDVPDGWWYLRAAADPRYALDIASGSGDDCANLQLWEWNRTSAQQFRFVGNSDGSCRIEARCSGKVLDVQDESRRRGANVQQVYWKGIDCQKWYVQDAGDGRIAVQSNNSGLYLDIHDAVMQNGQNVQQWSRNDADNARLFYLTPAEQGTPALVADGVYEVASVADGTLVVAGSAADEFATLAKADGSSYQAFRITTNGGRSRLLNVGKNQYMDVYAASIRQAARVNLVGDTGTMQQHWYVEDAGGGTVSLRNDLTNLYLDVKNGDASVGATLQMYRGNGTPAQRFNLRRLTLADAKADDVEPQIPTGSAIEPALTVRFAGRVLRQGRDYTVTWRDNVGPGTARATLSGAGNFSGVLEVQFKILDLYKPGWLDLGGGEKGYVKNNKLVTGWMDLGNSKFYFDARGRMLRGWQDVELNGKTMHYYFNPTSGNLARGTWMTIGGKKYYFRTSGNVAHGWATIPDNGVVKKYYFDDSHQMVTGWQDIEVNGKTNRYYFRPSGAMATGWAKIDGEQRFFRVSGNMAIGFTDVPEDSYKRYFDAEGRMLTGWQDIGGKTYYFRASGAMQTGKATIDGAPCEFSDKGVLVGGPLAAQDEAREVVLGTQESQGDDPVDRSAVEVEQDGERGIDPIEVEEADAEDGAIVLG